MPHASDLAEDRIEAPEAAAILGVELPELYRLVRQEAVPHWRLGRRVRFSRARLEAFIDAGGTRSKAA
ncbi:MAG: helix-turn-helix domain-containing protein [Gemmatimonadetes bacterium]|nr:helix-turn-helix domain-containing protein [Gemmatimonadota bacterium]